MATRRWSPTPVEQKCLRHLDQEGAWKWLGVEPPAIDATLGWRPFVRIFWFNLAMFLPIFAVFGYIGWQEVFSGDGLVQDQISIGVVAGFVVAIAGLFAAVATRLYRRSWNRRASAYQQELNS